MNNAIGAARRISLVAAFALACLLLNPRAASGSDIFTDYSIASWTARTGLPSGAVWSIAQDASGYLWLATDAGLVRFDGVRFVNADTIGLDPLPGAPARSLASARDGAIWVGFGRSAGIARIQNRRVRVFDARHGLGAGTVRVIVEDQPGSMLAGMDDGLYRLEGDEWRRILPSTDRPPVQILSVAPTSRDVLVATSVGVYRQDHQGPWRRLPTYGEGIAGIAVEPSGAVWTTDQRRGFRRDDSRERVVASVDEGVGNRLFIDSRGTVWVGTRGQGLWRVRRQTAGNALSIDAITTVTGLSGDSVYAVIEDRQGNIWLGTTLGLTQLVPRKLTVPREPRFVRTMAASRAGRVWVATPTELLEIAADGEANAASSASTRIAVQGVRALHADTRGRTWALTSDRLLEVQDGRLRHVPIRSASSLRDLTAITSDLGGSIWIYDAQEGLHRQSGSSGRVVKASDPVGKGQAVTLHSDQRGRLWIVSDDGTVRVLVDGVVRERPRHKTASRPALLEDRQGNVWIVSDAGLGRIGADATASLPPSRLPWGRFLSAVIDGSDRLWVGTESSLVRVSLDEFDDALRDQSHVFRRTVFDQTDGLAGSSTRVARPNAIRSSDGRLWFVTGRGISSVNPSLDPDDAPARVQVESLAVDGIVLAADSDPRIGPGTPRVAIDYTLVNLTSPLKARFRYLLEGFDDQWTLAGTQRQATYTNLPPGQYRFRVQATNDVGSWTEPGATLAFTIQPFFFQTTWFLLLSMMGVVLTAYAGWRARVRQIEGRATLVMNERLRLSREIHDTLMQGLAGVALQFDVLARRADPASRSQLERLRDFVEDCLGDARRSIWNLRSDGENRSTLDAALRSVGERAAGLAGVGFDFVVTGGARRCDPDVEHQIFRIVQEAVTNSIRHAQATRLVVELHFSRDRVKLRVSDDGCGFGPDADGQEGSTHFGILGMRERAEQVGGTFSVGASPHGGTTVEASIPITVAEGTRH